MKNLVMKAFAIVLVGTLFLHPVESHAAGKTIGSYKCTSYKGKDSDAKTIYDGVKSKKYTGKYLEAASKKSHLLIFTIRQRLSNIDKVVAIVDGEGVKYTAVNWSEIEGR